MGKVGEGFIFCGQVRTKNYLRGIDKVFPRPFFIEAEGESIAENFFARWKKFHSFNFFAVRVFQGVDLVLLSGIIFFTFLAFRVISVSFARLQVGVVYKIFDVQFFSGNG